MAAMQEKMEDGSKVFGVFGETNTDDLFPGSGRMVKARSTSPGFRRAQELEGQNPSCIDIYPATGGSRGCDQTTTTSWMSSRSRFR